MCYRLIYFMSFVLFMSLVSCGASRSVPSATLSGPRIIVLDGYSISERDVGRFKSWYCKDFTNGGPILVEVGIIEFPDSLISMLSESPELSILSPLLEFAGFVLYDGGHSGDLAIYERTGLENRWDWGPNGTDYSFVIRPDGTGLYYDFSTVPKGESTKARAFYKCYTR